MESTTRSISPATGTASLALSGELDLVCAPALTEQLASVLAASPDLLVDLRRVTFLDAAAMSSLVGAQQQARAAGGSLILVGASAWIERVLTTAQVTDLIPMMPSRPDVRAAHSRDTSLTSALRKRRTIC